MQKITSLSKEELENLFKTHSSIRSILIYLTVNPNGSGAYNTLKFHASYLGCTMPDYKVIKSTYTPKRELVDILTVNSVHQNRAQLRTRLLKHGLLIEKCYCCGIKTWMNKKISLHLDHINGINNDNSIENLRLLCPNCHSQTDTYGSKNKQKKVKVHVTISIKKK